MRSLRSKRDCTSFRRALTSIPPNTASTVLGRCSPLDLRFLLSWPSHSSSFWFILVAWPLLVLAGYVCFRFLRQGVADWANLHTAARRVDLQAGLKQRLSTLTAQILANPANGPPASRLWTYLLRDNLDRLSLWEVKKVAPRRIPWSVLPFLAAVVFAFLVASIPLLSPASEPEPFSLTNLELISSELPERTGQLVDKRLSTRPEDFTARPLDSLPVGETLSEQADSQISLQDHAADEEGLGQELLELASLPEDLQQALQTALQGLQESQSSLDERDAAEGRHPPQRRTNAGYTR